MVIQNISASFRELFPNYVPRPPLPRKVGGHDPPAPMGAPPLHPGRRGLDLPRTTLRSTEMANVQALPESELRIQMQIQFT